MAKIFLSLLSVLFFSSFSGIAFCLTPGESSESLYKEALAKIMSGQRQEGEALLREYIGKASSADNKNKALYDLMAMLAEEGRNAEALEAASSGGLPSSSFFACFEKGWSLLSLGRPEEAVKSFTKAKALTANQAYLSQSDFAISLAEARKKNTEKALEIMAAVYTRYPYLLSASSHELGRLLYGRKEYERAVFFIGSSLQYDSTNFQAEIDFAEANEKKKSYTQAWQAWRTLQEIDPDEKRYDRKLKKLSKKVKGEKENLMFWQRMDWPAHTSPRTIYGGNKVDIALYASPSGKQSELLEFSFMASSDFDIKDDKLGDLASGKKMTPWKIVFNPEEKIIELHDSLGASARSTYGNINIISRDAGGVILLKDPVFAEDIPGVNRSDKEAGGELRIDIAENGIRLKTAIDEESLACPITSSLINRSYETSFAKAAAVAARTKIRHFYGHPAHGDYAHMCDSRHCLEFAGMQAENMTASSAVEDTYGQVLVRKRLPGEIPETENVSWVKACGGIVKTCLPEDEKTVFQPVSPFGLYSSFINAPDEQIMCLPESKLDYIDLNWTVLLSPYWIDARANRIKKIGKIKAIVPMKRYEDGRVFSVRAYGSKGNLDIEGEDKVSAFLSAGTLRSSLFSIRPVYKGRNPEYFIVRGRGTASPGQPGNAPFCLRGAEGMSSKKNAGYKEILSAYFPDSEISPETPLSRPEHDGSDGQNSSLEVQSAFPELGNASGTGTAGK